MIKNILIVLAVLFFLAGPTSKVMHLPIGNFGLYMSAVGLLFLSTAPFIKKK